MPNQFPYGQTPTESQEQSHQSNVCRLRSIVCIVDFNGYCIRDHSQQTITCLNSTIEILEKGVKYIQN